MTKPLRLLEVSDAARLEGISAELVRREAAIGRIRVFATTARGTRLFLPEDVATWQAERKERARTRKWGRPRKT